MALTKSVAAVDEWEDVAQNTIREGAVVDISSCYQAALHIYCCLSSITAHSGTEIIVEVSSASSGDEDWTPWARYLGPVGTATKVDLGEDEAAGQTVLTVIDPVTNNIDINGKFIFLKNTATIANSEVAYQTSNSGDAGDTITVLDGLTNAQTAANTDIYTVDSPTVHAVSQNVIVLPNTASRVRVIYNNTYHTTGSSVSTYSIIEKITGL